jgi:uncharacterized protein (TIGR02145 family)
MTDVDGNVYRAIRIGDAIWTAENFRATRYNDSTPIMLDTATETWPSETVGKYCYYANTAAVDSIKKYGALYNFEVMYSYKLAPKGWHVPSIGEWTTLVYFLIANGYNWDGTTTKDRTAKSLAAMVNWTTSDSVGAVGNQQDKNNMSGFSAAPGGCRGSIGEFDGMYRSANWWSTTTSAASRSYKMGINFNYEESFKGDCSRMYGLAIRLVKDKVNTTGNGYRKLWIY